MTDKDGPKQMEPLLDVPSLSDALESERFRQFLDHIPFAVAVAELHPSERLIYANIEFERLTGQAAANIHGKRWSALVKSVTAKDDGRLLSEAIAQDDEYLGEFTIQHADRAITVDAWSNAIKDDDATEKFRLLALADISHRVHSDQGDMEQRIHQKDTLLRELQHRVKNNLQMVTALIRHEARNLADDVAGEHFDRLAGRVNALALLYGLLSGEEPGDSVDLGVYLSQIASAVMKAHAMEGIRLDMKVDTWPVSINVAMPAGLVVNEVLTNALKHAFVGREGGTVTLHSLVDETGCRVVVADDGVGLPDATKWPQPGKLAALIVESLRQNAGARVDVNSVPGKGVRVTILFAQASAAPET